MSVLCCGRFLINRAFSIAQRATFATQPVADPIQRAFVEKLREYQGKSRTAEMGLVGASEAQIKSLKDSLEKLDNVFNAKGVDMAQFPVLQHKEPELANPGSSIVVDYPPPETLQDVEEIERLDGSLTKGPIVF
ncbi:ATP synthase-coupling factor 6 mitochondrial [Taenia solium]|eukprot:TsM_000058500 transcript=TsM_000058500 gene=TsM_000058500